MAPLRFRPGAPPVPPPGRDSGARLGRVCRCVLPPGQPRLRRADRAGRATRDRAGSERTRERQADRDRADADGAAGAAVRADAVGEHGAGPARCLLALLSRLPRAARAGAEGGRRRAATRDPAGPGHAPLPDRARRARRLAAGREAADARTPLLRASALPERPLHVRAEPQPRPDRRDRGRAADRGGRARDEDRRRRHGRRPARARSSRRRGSSTRKAFRAAASSGRRRR